MKKVKKSKKTNEKWRKPIENDRKMTELLNPTCHCSVIFLPFFNKFVGFMLEK
jgi:hypothetical protein